LVMGLEDMLSDGSVVAGGVSALLATTPLYLPMLYPLAGAYGFYTGITRDDPYNLGSFFSDIGKATAAGAVVGGGVGGLYGLFAGTAAAVAGFPYALPAVLTYTAVGLVGGAMVGAGAGLLAGAAYAVGRGIAKGIKYIAGKLASAASPA